MPNFWTIAPSGRRTALLFLSLVFLYFFALDVGLIPAYGQICEQSGQPNEKNCAAHEVASFAFVEIGTFFDDHEGGIQALTAVFVVFFTFNLLRVSSQQSESMQRQTNLLDKQLNLAEKQTNISGLQADIAEKQKEIQRMEFFATHRPRLIVRKCSLQHENATEWGSYHHIIINFEIANVGGTIAKMHSASILLSAVGGIPAGVSEVADNPIPADFSLEGGAAQSFTATIAHYGIAAAIESNRFTPEQPPVFDVTFHGVIVYQDGRGVKRTTEFCRRHDTVTNKFVAVQDTECEYAD